MHCTSTFQGLCLLQTAAHLLGPGLPPCFTERASSATDVMLQDALVQQSFVANPELQSKLLPVCDRVCLLKLCKGRLIVTETGWFCFTDILTQA